MSVVQRVDHVLKESLSRGPLSGSRIPVTFETPGTEWSARRNGPCVNVFLHSVEEDAARSQTGQFGIVDGDGTVVGYHRPPRYFSLSYLVTVWAQTVTDEHSLMGRVLEWCAVTESLPLPPESPGAGADTLDLRMRATGGRDGTGETPAARLWSTLGTPARPALDLVVTVPLGRETTGAGPAPSRGLTLRAGPTPAALVEGAGHTEGPDTRTGRARRRVEEFG